MMKKMLANSQGFSIVEIVVAVLIIGVIAVAGWLFISDTNSDKKVDDQKLTTTQADQVGEFIWQQTAEGWQALSPTPTCPDQPMLKSPADLSQATSILYPGQTRGGYKPHGGIRFDNNDDNVITVTAPMDGYIIKGTRNFAEGTTEVQYGFDIMNNCGIMYRFGHLRELPTNLQKIAETFPEPSNDSASHNVNPPIYIKQGEVIATKVGLISEKNTFFDWGVYDYRHQNQASQSPTYQAQHPQDIEKAWHAVCWFDWLPTADEAKVRSLPAGGGENGKVSDYCK